MTIRINDSDGSTKKTSFNIGPMQKRIGLFFYIKIPLICKIIGQIKLKVQLLLTFRKKSGKIECNYY